jgi:4-methyl-5(b-hydroxyethyl)-thiazole monophosphate biosynthesis
MVYIFLADGFEECEAVAPIDILRRAGAMLKNADSAAETARVVTVAVGTDGTTVTSPRRVRLIADIHEKDITTPEGIEMVILPGGLGGVENMEKSEKVMEIISHCHANNIPIAAICAAPTILAKAGLLNGRKAVCYPSMTDVLTRHGAVVTDDKVITDGIFTTSAGAGTSIEFALECVKVLYGEKAASDIGKAIVFDYV